MKSLLTSSVDPTVNLPFNSSYSNVLIKHSNLTFCIYLPQKNSKGEIIPPAKRKYWINRFSKEFITFFGGYSLNNVNGTYLNSNQILINEVTTIISASLFKQISSAKSIITELLCLLLEFAIDTQQEVVLFNINGKFKLLYKTS